MPGANRIAQTDRHLTDRVRAQRGHGLGGLCSTGKLILSSKRAAKRHLKRMQRKRQTENDEAPEVAAYLCPTCSGWHCTSQSQRPRPGRVVVV